MVKEGLLPPGTEGPADAVRKMDEEYESGKRNRGWKERPYDKPQIEDHVPPEMQQIVDDLSDPPSDLDYDFERGARSRDRLSENECTIKVQNDRGNDPCEGVITSSQDEEDKAVSCEDHFYEENHRWYRCRDHKVDRRTGRMKCRAKAFMGRVTCDMPVRADAHLRAAAACT